LQVDPKGEAISKRCLQLFTKVPGTDYHLVQAMPSQQFQLMDYEGLPGHRQQ
jgi:hypothetical protein